MTTIDDLMALAKSQTIEAPKGSWLERVQDELRAALETFAAEQRELGKNQAAQLVEDRGKNTTVARIFSAIAEMIRTHKLTP